MELSLEKLNHFDLHIDGFEEVSACSYQYNCAVVWKQPTTDKNFNYLLKIFDREFNMISSFTFQSQITYNVVRMYRNICILIDTAGGMEKSKYNKNATIITLDGVILKEFPIGMGINNISISPQGTIWCSYEKKGTYKSFLPKTNKKKCGMIAAWNFFGELIYEMNCDDTTCITDVSSIFAKDNNEVYYLNYHTSNVYLLKDMKDTITITIHEKQGIPCDFIMIDNRMLIHYNDLLKDEKYLKLFHVEKDCLNDKDTIYVTSQNSKVNDYKLSFNNHDILLFLQHKLYRIPYEVLSNDM